MRISLIFWQEIQNETSIDHHGNHIRFDVLYGTCLRGVTAAYASFTFQWFLHDHDER